MMCIQFYPSPVSMMPSNSWTLKNVHTKVLIFGKKVFTRWIWTCNLLNASQLLYPLSYMAAVFDRMLLKFFLLHRLQPTAECKLATALTRDDKLEWGRWWVYGVRRLIYVAMSIVPSELTVWQMDGETDGQDLSFIHIHVDFRGDL